MFKFKYHINAKIEHFNNLRKMIKCDDLSNISYSPRCNLFYNTATNFILF